MNIYLGNIVFSQVEDKLGYKLTDEDKILWDKYHSDIADISKETNAFHIFYMPLEIHVKGDEAVDAIKKMFTPDKIVKSVGLISVRIEK